MLDTRQREHLGVLGQELEHLVHLVLEATREHFICFIKTEHLEVIGPEGTTIDHIVHTTWCTDNNLSTIAEACHVFTDIRTTNTGMALDVHVVTQGNNDILNLLSKFTSGGQNKRLNSLQVRVDTLQNGNRERGGLTRTRLGLRNNIVTFDHWNDSTGLNSRGAFET